jgi:hypothetical protein
LQTTHRCFTTGALPALTLLIAPRALAQKVELAPLLAWERLLFKGRNAKLVAARALTPPCPGADVRSANTRSAGSCFRAVVSSPFHVADASGKDRRRNDIRSCTAVGVVLVRVAYIFASRSPLEVGHMVVARVAVFVIDLSASFRCRAEKCLCHETVDGMALIVDLDTTVTTRLL